MARYVFALLVLSFFPFFARSGEVAPAAAQLPPAPELKSGDFDRLHALIKPGFGESRWAEIPWMSCLWEARKKAAAEGKPLLIWYAAEGNPIGLT